MNQLDLKVLERIGYEGAELAQIIEVAEGDYDIDSLIRTGYVRLHREHRTETTGSRFQVDDHVTWYVLSPKGARTISLDPDLLN